MMERIRSLSRASSQKSEPRSANASPEPARDVVFTPTADQVCMICQYVIVQNIALYHVFSSSSHLTHLRKQPVALWPEEPSAG